MRKLPSFIAFVLVLETPRLFASCPIAFLPGDGIPGTAGQVNAAAVWDPDGDGPESPVLVVGGYMSIAGNAKTQGLAYWDGQEWRSLGSIETLNGIGAPQVSSIISFNDDLIVAGDFSRAGGVLAENVARWDGSTWHPFSAGLGGSSNAQVSALAVYDGQLIAGGFFSASGSKNISNVAQWDGNEWQPVGEGLNSAVSKLMVVQGRLIAGGAFTKSGEVSVKSVASWDGVTWSQIGEGFNGQVYDLHVQGRKLIAVGLFTSSGSTPLLHVAMWNGMKWRPMGNGIPWTPRALTVYDGEVYVGGDVDYPGRGIVRWAGRTWEPVGTGMNGFFVLTLIPFQGELVAAGRFDTADGKPAQNMARWNHQTWNSVGVGTDEPITCMTNYNGSLIAGGYFSTIGGVPSRYVAHWDGAGWSAMDSGIEGSVYALVVYGNELIASTTFKVMEEGEATREFIGKWNGNEWVPFEVGVNGGVSAMVIFQDELVVAGGFDTAGGVSANHVAAWNGENWRNLGEGLPKASATLVVYRNELIAGGYFCHDSTVSCVLGWDGSQWQSVGEGIFDNVYALAVYDDELIAGGDFEGAANGAADYIAAWDGSAWHALGEGLGKGNANYADVRALAIYQGDLVVAGTFFRAGGMQAKSIARWNGIVGWEPLEGPKPGWFNNLAVYGRELFAGGGVFVVDNSVSAYWAHWGPSDDFGDVNNDLRITYDDFAAWAGCFGGPDSSSEPTSHSESCLCTFNSDGDADVDLLDMARLQNIFQGN